MSKLAAILSVALTITVSNSIILAQKKVEVSTSQLCNRNSALDIIQQQAAAAKTFDNVVQRIAILIRAADLMWPYQQAKAKNVFVEAFDLANADYKQKGEQTTKEGRMPVELPDQRYVVIAAIAKRDPVWARKLSDDTLQQQLRTQEQEAPAKSAFQLRKNAEKLLGLAMGLVASDPSSAVLSARSSLRYPAGLNLPLFLYRLADKNRALADSFYQEALAAYAKAPMEQFLYLSSYPFANSREAGEMPSWTTYKVPASLTANQSLQRAFIQILLRHAQEVGQGATDAQPDAQYTEAAQIWMALSRLEDQVQTSLTDLTPAVREAKGSMFVLMSQKDQQRTASMLIEPPRRTFAEQIEAAEKQSDPERREGEFALAILGVFEEVPIDTVVAAADKIYDPTLRAQVLSRFYFNRTQVMLNKKEFEQARMLAAKVENLDHRAYLYSQIVTALMDADRNDVQVRDILEEVASMASKAPNTEIKARALLAIAYLFQKVDANRSISVLGDAIKTINQLENPDFSREYILTRIEGKQFGYYSGLSTPGFNPENAFREMGKFDFDGMFYQVGQFNNKQLRVMTTLALVEPCLQQEQRGKRKEVSAER